MHKKNENYLNYYYFHPYKLFDVVKRRKKILALLSNWLSKILKFSVEIEDLKKISPRKIYFPDFSRFILFWKIPWLFQVLPDFYSKLTHFPRFSGFLGQLDTLNCRVRCPSKKISPTKYSYVYSSLQSITYQYHSPLQSITYHSPV